MDDRDALINLIAPHLSGGPKGSVGHTAQGWFAEQIADAILAAGWRAPDTTWQRWREIANTPVRMVCTDKDGVTHEIEVRHDVTGKVVERDGRLVVEADIGDGSGPQPIAVLTDDYKQARGAAKLDRPAEEIIREGRGE
jgi:hypothetical protein